MLKRGFQFAPGYRLQEFLGRGQFGQVWRASAPGGTATAAKFIDLSDGQGQKEYDAVRRVKQIRHANLMPITAIWLLDAQGAVIEEAPDEALETIDLSADEPRGRSAIYSPDDDPHWLVVAMLLGGSSLAQRLRECGAEGLQGLPPKELIAYMDESAKGIDFLNAPRHDLGDGPIAIQHCDIKPANIVLIGNSAVVCDFGLARILKRNQVTATSPTGTPAYMAPEAISGRPSRSSDQYSLAVTYYHLRTGKLPIHDGSLWEVLDAHRYGRLMFDRVPEPEQNVLRKATHLNWEQRFENCCDFVDALRDALRSEGETRPSFVVPVSSTSPSADQDSSSSAQPSEQPLLERESASQESDESNSEAATQTLDLAEPVLPADESIHVSRDGGPFVGTRPDEPSDAAQNRFGPLQRLKEHPVVAAVLAVVASVLLIGTLLIGTGILAPGRGDDQVSRQGGGLGDGEDSAGVDGGLKLSADELLTSALALVDVDPEEAATQFQAALSIDQSIQPRGKRWQGAGGGIFKGRASSDGRWLATADDSSSLRIRDLRAVDAPPRVLAAHQLLLNDFHFADRGNAIITGGDDSTPRYWNLADPEMALSPRQLMSDIRGEIKRVTWCDSDDLAIAISSDGKVAIWRASSWMDGSGSPEEQSQPRVIETGQSLSDAVCDPTGQWLAIKSFGADLVNKSRDVVLFRLPDVLDSEGSPEPLSLDASNVTEVAFLRKAAKPTLVVGEVGASVALMDADSQTLIDRHEPKDFRRDHEIVELRVASDADGDVIVAGASDGTVLYWSTGVGSTGVESARRRPRFSDVSINSVDVSADGRWVACGTAEGAVWLWDAEANRAEGAVRLLTESESVESVVLTEDWLIAGCDDGTIEMWDLRHLKLMTMVTPTSGELFDDPVIEIETPKLTMR